MLTGLIGGAITSVIAIVATFFATRTERNANLHEKLATSALDRMDRAEKRLDGVERTLDQIRREIHPHRAWDEDAYRRAKETDPDFPPPPPLSI